MTILFNFRLICTCLILGGCLLPYLASAQSAARIARLDSVLNYLHERQLFNGSVLVGENGNVRYAKSFGISDSKTGTRLNQTSAFNLASVSKQFYAMMVMMLQEKGKLRYDDSVQQYLPDFPYAGITIRQLMNQTSGLPEYFDLAERSLSLLDTLTNESLLTLLATQKPALRFAPGEKWEYCNTNYTTLASVIEKASGMRVDQFLAQYIARPLGLKHTYVYHLKLPLSPPSRVFGFRYEKGKPVPDDLIRIDGIAGDGNVYASAEDLYRWEQALYTGKLVSRRTFAEAITPGKLSTGEPTRYGFGWFIEEPGRVVSHTGGWVGFRNLIVRYLDKQQTLILLDNSGNATAYRIARAILEDKAFDLPQTQLIRNVQVIDGSGTAARPASVRIVGNRIGDMGELLPFPGESVTDGQGLVLAPGFIDSHSHHDWGLNEQPELIAATNQGITTIVVGQDGGSGMMDTLRAQLAKRPVSVNLATYTGHAQLRRLTMKTSLARTANLEELEEMKAILRSELAKGSLGLSTGLEYEDAFYASRTEVLELAKVAAEAGGRYISHIRSEDIHLEESVDEIIAIGREAKLPVQISHLKIAMRSKWGSSDYLLARLQQARAEGVNISADCYPYTMWMSTPRVLFPKKDFTNPESALFATRELFDPASSVLVRFSANPGYEGKTVSQMNNETPGQGLLRIIREGTAPGVSQSIAGTSMQEADIVNFLRWPHTNICSDGSVSGHPRGYGAFTRFLGRYVREQQIMPLETAIHKMTGLTAEHLGIRNRGLIAPGYYADLVLLNPETVMDRASITDPKALSEGIEKVWVNGQVVYAEQQATHAYPGVLISRPVPVE
jgi:N-acyl-D-amino-acid deacylase